MGGRRRSSRPTRSRLASSPPFGSLSTLDYSSRFTKLHILPSYSPLHLPSMSGRDGGGAGRVKNRAPAAIQVSRVSLYATLVYRRLISPLPYSRSPPSNCSEKPPTSRTRRLPSPVRTSRTLRNCTSTADASGKSLRK